MQLEGTNQSVQDKSIERLQLILASEKYPLTLSEVRMIGYDLVKFFELLAEDSYE